MYFFFPVSLSSLGNNPWLGHKVQALLFKNNKNNNNKLDTCKLTYKSIQELRSPLKVPENESYQALASTEYIILQKMSLDLKKKKWS